MQPAARHRVPVGTQARAAALQGHRPSEQGRYPAAEPDGPPGLGPLDLAAGPQQVGQALLLGEGERVIRQEAVAD